MTKMQEAIALFRDTRAALFSLNNREQEAPVDERTALEDSYYSARQALKDLLLPLLSEDDRQAMRYGLKEYGRLAGILHAAALARFEALDARMEKVLAGGFATTDSVSDPAGQIRAEQNGLDEFYNNLIEKAIETLEEKTDCQCDTTSDGAQNAVVASLSKDSIMGYEQEREKYRQNPALLLEKLNRTRWIRLRMTCLSLRGLTWNAGCLLIN